MDTGQGPTKTPLKFTVAVDGRTVRIELSSDKVRWVPVGPSARTKADGTLVVSVPGPAVGSWSYRATVAQYDKFVAAVSPVVGATVEDIKAAAATYLHIVNEYNAALHAYGKAVQPTYAPSVPASWRSAARDYSAADTKAAPQLRAYGAWPQSVKPLIEQIIAQHVIPADNLHQLSATTGFEQWDREDAQFSAANVEGARLSTLIRQALGLPQQQAG